MTHVWLLPRTRTAFATCAPWAELERIHGLRREPYHAHVNTEPCPGGDSEHGVSMSH
jgi:hypothetical protein